MMKHVADTTDKLIDALFRLRAKTFYGLPQKHCDCQKCKDLNEIDELYDAYESKKETNPKIMTGKMCADSLRKRVLVIQKNAESLLLEIRYVENLTGDSQ